MKSNKGSHLLKINESETEHEVSNQMYCENDLSNCKSECNVRNVIPDSQKSRQSKSNNTSAQ